MGLLAGSTAVLRLVAPPPTQIDRAALTRAVSRRAFGGLDPDGGEGVEASGWVGIHDPLATDLSAADLFFQHYLAVGFRWDRRTIPAKLLTLERRRLEEARKVERGLERLGAAARREVKEEVEARLLARALPTPRLYDCVWNLETGMVYFTGRQRRAVDAFGDCFRRTFGVGPVPLVPYLAAEYMGLPSSVVEAVRAVAPARLVGDDDAGTGEPESVPHLPLEEAPR